MSFRGQKIFKPCRSGHPESRTPQRICLTQWRGELGIASLSFPFSFPPLPFPFSPLPLASIRSRTPKIQVEGLGSAEAAPVAQWIWSGAPTEIEFGFNYFPENQLTELAHLVQFDKLTYA